LAADASFFVGFPASLPSLAPLVAALSFVLKSETFGSPKAEQRG